MRKPGNQEKIFGFWNLPSIILHTPFSAFLIQISIIRNA